MSLLLDKTGTITLGNREAVELIPVDGTDITELAEVAQLASLADETPEGRSIVVLVKDRYGLRGRTVGAHNSTPEMQFIPVLQSNQDERGRSCRDRDPKRSSRSGLCLHESAGKPGIRYAHP